MKKHLNRKFSGFLIAALILSAISGIAKNKWQDRMEKPPNSTQPTSTEVSNSGSGGMVVGESDVNCMNVKVRLSTNILTDNGTVSEVPITELANGAGRSFACTAFAPPLHGDGQPVTAGNVNVVCAGGKLTVTSSNCALKPKDCPAGTTAIPAGILSGSPASNIPNGAIAHGGSASYNCTTASPGLTLNGVAVDRGAIAVSCTNGVTAYAGHSCAVPPPCPAGSCYAACNSWCSDGTSVTGLWKVSCKAAGKNTQNCTWGRTTYRTCQNGQYYRTITYSYDSNNSTTSTGWACSSSTTQ